MTGIVEKLANGVIAGPDDLMGIGECLNLLDQLESAYTLAENSAQDLQELRQALNRIILGESNSLESDWSSVHTLIQDICAGTDGETAVSEADPAKDDSGEDNEDSSEGPASGAEEHAGNVDWQIIQQLMQEVGSDKSGGKGESAECASCESGENASPEGEALVVAVPESAEENELQDPDLLRDFLEEANEHLSSIELNILALEENPDNQEAINSIFRPFHSVKGVAGFLNLKDIHYLSHEVENLLDDARSKKLVVTDDVIDIVLKSVDLLKSLLSEVDRAFSEGNAVKHGSPVVQSFLEQVRAVRDQEHTEPSAAAPKKVGEILVERGVVKAEAVEQAAAQGKTTGRRIGEELISVGVATPREVSSALREQRSARENSASVRIDTLKLDNLVDMVGELVIAQSMVLQNPEVQLIKDQKYQKDSVQLRRITNELQRISMSMRMVPIKSTFQKMIRLVRDLAKKSGKDVTLEMKGEETEIDRNMVEEIYEPLVHMIRNSIDHGIEAPDERVRLGKDPCGTIIIGAEQKGGNIVIDIKDDGKGIDAGKVRETAIKRGLISPDEQLDERATYDLIFRPGFSTADKVTDVSGRGVGMDVVKKSVERLRGKVEVFSTRGKGSHIQFKLPLTMAIIDGMVIYVGNERYIVPTISLKESFRPAEEAYVTVHGNGEMVKVREALMPLIRLHEIFGVEPRKRHPWEALLLVVNEDSRSYCLLADEIAGRQEVVIKSLGSSLRHVVGVSGGAILGDGKVALIIDVKGVVNQYEGNAR